MYSLREFVDGHGQESVLINNRRSIFKFSLQSNRIPFVVYQIKPSNPIDMFPILHQGNVSLFQKENYWRCDFVRILADHFLNLAKNTEGEENRDKNE